MPITLAEFFRAIFCTPFDAAHVLSAYREGLDVRPERARYAPPLRLAQAAKYLLSPLSLLSSGGTLRRVCAKSGQGTRSSC